MLTFLREFCTFLGMRKKLWLVPIMVVTFCFGVMFVLAEGSVIAPFIYTLF